MYSYIYLKLDKLQQKLDVCGWHLHRDMYVCRRNFDQCCSTGGVCEYLGPRGCKVESLSCKFWLCEKALEYLYAIKSNVKHPLYKMCKYYLKQRVFFEEICRALDIPQRGRVSKFETFDVNNKELINTYIDRWFDNILERQFGEFISTDLAEKERNMGGLS
jgi:hypothetical protein